MLYEYANVESMGCMITKSSLRWFECMECKDALLNQMLYSNVDGWS